MKTYSVSKTTGWGAEDSSLWSAETPKKAFSDWFYEVGLRKASKDDLTEYEDGFILEGCVQEYDFPEKRFYFEVFEIKNKYKIKKDSWYDKRNKYRL